MKKLLLLIMSLSFVAISCSACNWFKNQDDSSSSISSSEQEEKVYKVTFVQDGVAVKVVEVKEGKAVEEADIPTVSPKTGYTVEWESVDLSNIKADTVVNAVSKANTYTITYDANGGSGVPSAPQKVTYDSNVTFAKPNEREGYTFLGWEKDGVILSEGKWTYAENVTLVARWAEITVKTYTITFQNSDGFVLGTKKVAEGGSLADADIPAFPSDQGYEYSWSETNFSNITEDMTVILNAVAKTYTITYNPGDGALVDATKGTQTVTYGSAYELSIPDVVYEGYKFVEWSGINSLPEKVWNITNDVTLTAVWEEVPPTVYTVTFEKEDGTTIRQVYVEEGASLADTDIPAFPNDQGYEYSWSDTNFSNITGDKTVTLNAVAKTYTITYDPDGGSLVSGELSETVTYKTSYTLHKPKVEKAGYNFRYWEIVGEDALSNEGIWTLAKDVTLKAVWEKKATYTITFVQGGQEVKEFTDVEEGTNFDKIPTPADKPGYTVTWDGVALEQLKDVQQNVVVNAVETPNKYKITYSDAKGVFKGTIELDYNEKYDWTLENNPVTGYTFSKFKIQDGEKFVDVPVSGNWSVVGDVTVIVEWTANTYTVVLNPNGGECSERKITMTYDADYTLPTPTRDDHTFLGWKLNGKEIPTSGKWTYAAAGTIELVASWRSNEWTNNY